MDDPAERMDWHFWWTRRKGPGNAEAVRMHDVIDGTLHRRLAALEARAQAEPPKPEREPGWYVVKRKNEWAPNALWWTGTTWDFCPPIEIRHATCATAEWIGPRLDLPAEKVT